MIFSVFQKIWVLGILGPPYCGIGATIRIGREMLCLPYAGFFYIVFLFSDSMDILNKLFRPRQLIQLYPDLFESYHNFSSVAVTTQGIGKVNQSIFKSSLNFGMYTLIWV